MADVLVGVSREKGVVAVLVFWETEVEPCPAVSPSGVICALPEGHPSEWHVGFPGGSPTLMPKKWSDRV